MVFLNEASEGSLLFGEKSGHKFSVLLKNDQEKHFSWSIFPDEITNFGDVDFDSRTWCTTETGQTV